MTTTAAAAPTAADHAAYGSVTWLCALESATENWADHNGRQPETDAELAEVDAWALGYIDSGLSEVYEGDHLDLIAGTATPQTPAAEPVSTDTHATQEDSTMTDTTTPAEVAEAIAITTGRYTVARVSGRYRVVDNGGAILATVASKAAGQKWIDRKVQEAADLAQEATDERARLAAAREAMAALEAELTANADAIGAIMDEPLPGEPTMATPDEAAAQLAEEVTRPFTIGGRLAAAVDGDLATELDSVSAKIAARKPTKDGTRRIHVTVAEAAALSAAAKLLEGKARELVASGDRSAVSLVFSCTQAQANLAKLFAGPAV